MSKSTRASRDEYSIDEHRHRFAVWAAARAAQRGLPGGRISVLAEAIELCGVRDAVRTESSWHPDPEDFDITHRGWCNAIVKRLRQVGVSEVSFGRAAKLVAIYLKTVVVLAGDGNSALARVLHPPIDAILLRTMARDVAFKNSPSLNAWRTARWTTLDENAYTLLIASLRVAMAQRQSAAPNRSVARPPAFWMIEQYWSGSDA